MAIRLHSKKCPYFAPEPFTTYSTRPDCRDMIGKTDVGVLNFDQLTNVYKCSWKNAEHTDLLQSTPVYEWQRTESVMEEKKRKRAKLTQRQRDLISGWSKGRYFFHVNLILSY